MLQRHLDMVEEMLNTLATSPLLFSQSQVIRIFPLEIFCKISSDQMRTGTGWKPWLTNS